VTHALMVLPFDENALEPYISEETDHEDMSLQEIVKRAEGGIFSSTERGHSHNFYFNGMGRKATALSKELTGLFERNFASPEAFKEVCLVTASGVFGSGWT